MLTDLDTPDIHKRIDMVFEALGVTPYEVAKRLNVSNVKYYNIVRGDSKPNYNTLEELLTLFPQINMNWVMKGQKPILHATGAKIVGVGDVTNIFVTLPFLHTTDHMTSQSEMYQVLLPNDADPKIYNDAVVISLTDNAMADRLPAGAKVLGRPVPSSEWNFLGGGIYAVLYHTYFVVRRIKGNDLPTKNLLTIEADNPEFGYVHLKREDIKSIYKIERVVDLPL